MLAFITFRAQKIDIAVIETGLGGRLDATSIISPLSTVITSISREHTQLLGDDLESIASEKAGIIKENIPVILGPKARFQAIYDRAKLLNAPIYLSKNISHFFDEENSATAQLAMQHLPFTLPAEAIETGLCARPPCRFEKADDVLFDVAHNPDGFFHLLQALHTFYPKREMRFVVGFSADKDYEQCLELISSVATHIHLVQASTPRAAPLELLASAMEIIKKPLHTLHPSVMEGVQEAYALAQDRGELLVIAGSFYLMADAKQALGFYAPRDPMDLNEKILSESFASSKLT
jgi:dihydrofolate synthase/folylpolyglutamate synthase